MAINIISRRQESDSKKVVVAMIVLVMGTIIMSHLSVSYFLSVRERLYKKKLSFITTKTCF